MAKHLQTGSLKTINGQTLEGSGDIVISGSGAGVGTSELPAYSTSEVLTAERWIDGKPVYRKVVSMGALPNATAKSIAHGISNLDEHLDLSGVAFHANGDARIPLPYVSTSTSTIQMHMSKTNVIVTNRIDMSATYAKSYAIIYYTKTTDTALSPVALICGCSGGTGATDVVETTSSPVFGLLYNLTDDLYKRIGKNINPLTIGGFNEFSAWRSPTAERQNDADTAGPSPLTAWLDSTANLPFSSMKRYVIDKTGAEVKAYNANSYTHADQTGVTATQQVMVKIPAFHYIQARIVDGGKTYQLYAIANSSFTLDAVNDLKFASPTITLWNPTTGVSSGTAAGSVITSALHPAFVTNAGGTLTKRYYGAFNAVSGRSICGIDVKATADITRTDARTSMQGFGSGFTQIDWLLRSALDLLAIVERGSFYMERGGESTANKWEGYSWDSGVSSNDQDNGKTLALLNKTGVILDGSNRTIANSYRGIENYHSALWNWVDGVNLASNVVYLAKKGATYNDTSTTTNGYFSSGITVPSGAASHYISDLGAGTFIPTEISGSATTQMTDGAWTGSTALFVGGSMFYPSAAGVCTWASNSPASDSSWTLVARPAY